MQAWMKWIGGSVVLAGIILLGEVLWNPPPRPIARPGMGPETFPKYAFNGQNNPVLASPSLKHWKRQWTFTAHEPLQQASVAQGVVYATGAGGRDQIYAVSARSGRLLWKRPLNNVSMTTPIVANGLVYVGTGNQNFTASNQVKVNQLHSTHVIRGTGASSIYALNAKTGRVVWTYATRGENMPSFVYHQGVLYTADGHGVVHAFTARNGHLLWERKIGSYVSMSSPVLAHGVLYVSGAHPYDLYAIDVRTHRILWRRAVPQAYAGSDDCSLAVSHNKIYLQATTGSWNRAKAELDVFGSTGRLLWQKSLGHGPLPANIEDAAPTIHNHRVYVGSPITQKEYAISTRYHKTLWQFNAMGPVSESPAVVGNRVYFGMGTGMFYALNANTGKVMGSRFLSGALAADFPVVMGQTIYQPDENGQIFAFPFSQLTKSSETRGPRLPMPRGALGKKIKQGEALFMGKSLSAKGLSCDTCHAGGGTLTHYHQGFIVPSLIGAASTFPHIAQGKVVTLDQQINHCIQGMGGKPLTLQSRRLKNLNLYLHWLSSGFPSHSGIVRSSTSSMKGGC